MGSTFAESEYRSPLAARFASPEMVENFSEIKKFRTWRRIWIALAEAQAELGLPISSAQIAEMKAHADDIDLAAAAAYERRFRHDVMAHVHAFGDACPTARPIIHLGATSCDVTDNADILIVRDALQIILRKVVNVIDRLASFAERYRDVPALGWTHFQPAQLTTVGKRATLWAMDFLMDLDDIERRLSGIRLRGIRGATGTQASYLDLFDGDEGKVIELERRVALKLGIPHCFSVTGQTYPRKFDAQILALLSGIGQSASKFATDLRLLQHLHEVEEPFEETQIGSSAMPYKQNPMRCERITGLARFLICLEPNAAFTAATQWLERTLDDSSNRRLSLPEAFLAADAVLLVTMNVAAGMRPNLHIIERNVRRELPFMATESILMAAVKAGGDRQRLHEAIRRHSIAAAKALREGAEKNDLFDRIAADADFAMVREILPRLADPGRFIGRAPRQVEEFLVEHVAPMRQRHAAILGHSAELKV